MLKKSEKYHFIFNNIIELCSKKNITVSNVVESFSTSKSAMTAWKKGNIFPDTLAKLADFFEVSVEYLITGKEEQKLTRNEQELLAVFRSLDDSDQLISIGMLEGYFYQKKREKCIGIKTEESLESKNQEQCIGIQVARTKDGKPSRQKVTPEILETIKNLPEDTDY